MIEATTSLKRKLGLNETVNALHKTQERRKVSLSTEARPLTPRETVNLTSQPPDQILRRGTHERRSG